MEGGGGVCVRERFFCKHIPTGGQEGPQPPESLESRCEGGRSSRNSFPGETSSQDGQGSDFEEAPRLPVTPGFPPPSTAAAESSARDSKRAAVRREWTGASPASRLLERFPSSLGFPSRDPPVLFEFIVLCIVFFIPAVCPPPPSISCSLPMMAPLWRVHLEVSPLRSHRTPCLILSFLFPPSL